MATVLPSSAYRSLKVLGYPVETNALNQKQFKDIIVWLEDQKIRLWRQTERAGLKNIDPDRHDEWIQHLTNYLRSLGILPMPVPGVPTPSVTWKSAETRSWILSRLIALAVQDVYVDREEGGEFIVKEFEAERQSSEMNLQATAKQLDELLRSLELPLINIQPGPVTISLLTSILAAIETRLLPTETTQTHKPNLKLPLGFNVEEPTIREFCVALRLVHVNEIKKLQEHINETLSALQGVTGDPKTDIKQGRVGR